MRIRIDAVITTHDLDEGDVGHIVERMLEARFDELNDLSVYEVTHMLGYGRE